MMRKSLTKKLEDLGITTQTTEHPPLNTVKESQAYRGEIPGGHTKNLFLKCKKSQLWLVVCLEDANVDLKTLHKVLGSGRLSFGKPDLLMETLGVLPGSVTPFAAINDTEGRVTIVLDEPMLQYDQLNYHPLENTATMTITPDDLIKFLCATGHDPLILRLSHP